jgi:hypothetical protein
MPPPVGTAKNATEDTGSSLINITNNATTNWNSKVHNKSDLMLMIFCVFTASFNC